MLGVSKASGAFVPLDPSHPLPRLRSLVRAVGGSILLCSRQHVDLLATVAGIVLPVDHDMIEQFPPILNSTGHIFGAKSSNAAYLIFTSGSTGEPKVSTGHRFY